MQDKPVKKNSLETQKSVQNTPLAVSSSLSEAVNHVETESTSPVTTALNENQHTDSISTDIVIKNYIMNGQPFCIDDFSRINPDTNKATETIFEAEYPLYPILKLIHLLNTPEKANFVTMDVVKKVYAVFEKNIQQKNSFIMKNEDETSQLCIGLYFICNNLTNQLKKLDNDTLIFLSHQFLSVVKHYKKNITVKRHKAKIDFIIEGFLIDILFLLGLTYFISKNFQVAEMYCRKALDLLSTFKKIHKEDVIRRYSDIKGILAKIYLEFGHFDLAEQFIEENSKLLTGKIRPDFYDELLEGFGSTCEELIEKTKENNLKILKILRIAEFTLNRPVKEVIDLKKIGQKISKPFEETIQRYNFFQDEYKKAQAIYIESLKTVMPSTGIKQLVAKLQPDFSTGKLTLILKDKNHLFAVESAFNKADISAERNPSQSSISIDLYQCPSETLKTVFENARLRIEKEKEEAEKQRAAQKALSEKLATPLPSTTPFFAPEKQLEPVPMPLATSSKRIRREKPENPKKGAPSQPNTPLNTPSIFTKPIVKIEEYHWPFANLSYRSDEKNTGVVKRLKHPAIPDTAPVWFGYIPDYAKQHIHYDKDFEEKLKTGKIAKDGIRDIKKELENLNIPTYDKPYKFKIVLKKEDARLYGWIDEVITDKHSRKQYLICFGYIEYHGIKHLPDPETIKQKMDSTKNTLS